MWSGGILHQKLSGVLDSFCWRRKPNWLTPIPPHPPPKTPQHPIPPRATLPYPPSQSGPGPGTVTKGRRV